LRNFESGIQYRRQFSPTVLPGEIKGFEDKPVDEDEDDIMWAEKEEEDKQEEEQTEELVSETEDIRSLEELEPPIFYYYTNQL
jgi:hypothetical protein